MFSKPELTNVLLDALLRKSGIPDPKLSAEFKRKRYNRCAKALLTRNLLIPVISGPPGVANLKDVTIGYSQAVDTDLLLTNFTWADYSTNAGANAILNGTRMMRMQIDGRDIVSDVSIGSRCIGNGQSTSGFGSTVTGYGVAALPCPVRVPKGARVVVQFSYNPGGDAASVHTVAIDTVLLFCLVVKTCLSDNDQEILEQCRQWIETHEYQTAVYLNSATPPTNPPTSNVPAGLSVEWAPAAAGTFDQLAFSETRPINAPLLVRGMASNMSSSRISIRDTRGHAFNPGDMLNIRNLTQQQGLFSVSPYWRFAVPHVLGGGEQLKCEHRAGNRAGTTEGILRWLTWACVTP